MSVQTNLVSEFLVRIYDELARLKVDVVVETDFAAFAAFRRRVADGLVYPTFDPAHSRHDRRALWLRIVNHDGQTVGSFAVKVFETDDFYELMRTEELWFDRFPRTVRPGPEISRPFRSFGGIVGHSGGLWVDRPYRGLGLSTLIPLLGRAVLLRNFGIEHDTAVVSELTYRKRYAETLYRYSRVAQCADNYTGFAGYPEPVYLCHQSRDEFLRLMTEPAVIATPVKRQLALAV